MNLYLQAMAEALNGAPTYAWVITEDKVDDGEAVGTIGPHNAPAELEEPFTTGTCTMWTFRLYDDDGAHYFTGKLATLAESPDADESGPSGALMAPLLDLGEAYGCTRIAWQGHPEWEIG